MIYLFRSIVFILACITLQISQAQNLTQTVRGKVFDHFTREPLPGANIVLAETDPLRGTTTDENGNFRLEKVAVGRISIRVSFIGYEDKFFSELNLTAGKEMLLQVALHEKAITGKEVEIKASADKTKPINEMASVSARSFTVEESQRYAGSRNDVARMAANFAGVRGVEDSRNDIIIRGNSPLGLLWRLEGVDVPNPNHYGAMGTTGGPVSILNNNLLANSDCLTGAFPAQYGNAIAGVFDLKMRNGNNEQHEFLGQMGFNGFELGAEGPLSKENGSSYLFNYRYSTLEIFDQLGMEFGTGTAIPKYQDFSFKINLPNTGIGNLSVFAIGGKSRIAFLDSEKDTTNSQLDFYSGEGFDLINGSEMATVGINHLLSLSKNSYTKLTIAATHHNFNTEIDSISPEDYNIRPYYRNDFTQQKFFTSLSLHHRINSKQRFVAGFNINSHFLNLNDSIFIDEDNRFKKVTDYNGSMLQLQTYLQWEYRLGEKFSIKPGIHLHYLGLNGSFNAEPRLSAVWQYHPHRSISLAWGYHSQLQPVTVYFEQKKKSSGEFYRPNENLDFIKSNHLVLAHDWKLDNFLRLKTEVYYQKITDAAVNAAESDAYSILNQGANFFIPVPSYLQNSGTGTNYGMEFTLEKFLNKGLYYLFTTSVYESFYKGSDLVQRNTAFNGNYVVNALVGKDFNLDQIFKSSSKKFTFTTDIKTVLAGGQRYTPINVEASLEKGSTVLYEDLAYSKQFKDYFRTDMRIALRQNTRNLTMEWAIDFQNLFNTRNIYGRNFNEKTGEISFTHQLGLLVVPQFRIEF